MQCSLLGMPCFAGAMLVGNQHHVHLIKNFRKQSTSWIRERNNARMQFRMHNARGYVKSHRVQALVGRGLIQVQQHRHGLVPRELLPHFGAAPRRMDGAVSTKGWVPPSLSKGKLTVPPIGYGSKPRLAPVNIPIPTKIGSKMGGEFAYQQNSTIAQPIERSIDIV